jgi:hypothetical protein
MVTSSQVQSNAPRGWLFSIVLFGIATVGEFVALSGWYVLHHANAHIDAEFYDVADAAVRWFRNDMAFLHGVLAPLGTFLLSPHLVIAVLVLWAGFVVERAMVVIWLRVPRLVMTPAGHLRSRLLVIGGVTVAEIVVWLVWVWIAEAGEPIFAAAVLTIGIHFVHAYEVALVKHKAFAPLLSEPGVIIITLLEGVGGAWALSQATHGRIVAPLLIMGGALLTEHILQVSALKMEAAAGRPS